MSLMKELVKGKVKTVYAVDNVEHVMIFYHDRVTAGNGEKEDTISDKGSINCQITDILFKELEKQGIETHRIERIGHTMLCQKVKIIPIEFVVRNIAAGSIVRQTTLTEGRVLDFPLVEYYLKDDTKNDPLLTEDRMTLMGYDNMTVVEMKCLAVNMILKDIFSRIGLNLVDFKLEFGHDANGNLLLADELSPDSMRLWKKGTQESMDKDIFRKGDGNIIPAYQKILDDLVTLLYNK